MPVSIKISSIKRLILALLLTGLTWVPLSVWAQEAPVQLSIDQNAVNIRAAGATLKQVLEAIANKTGINFVVAEDLEADSIEANISASTWKEGVEYLLQPYATMQLWNDTLKFSKVHIMSRDESFAGTSIAPRSPAKKSGGTDGGTTGAGASSPHRGPDKLHVKLDPNQIPTAQGLNARQLRRLGRGKLKSPLSQTFLLDPTLQPFLKQFGIETPEDAQDTLKAMKVRIQARRLAKQLQNQ